MTWRRRRTWLSASLLGLGVLVASSCGVGGDGNPFVGPSGKPSNGCTGCQDVVAVRVNPAQSTIVVNATVQLSGEAVNSDGQVLTGRTIAWNTSDEEVAKVTSGGVVSGLAAGSVTISGSTGGVTGTASVIVEAASSPVGR